MGLIRVRKLAWVSDGDCQYCETGYGTYAAFSDSSWALVLGSYDDDVDLMVKHGRAETIEAAIAACQADFERRVLAEIEVVPLSFPDGHGWSECGNYYVNDTIRWQFVYVGNGPELTGKALTREEAIDACNAHNQRLILGETEQ